MDFEKRVTDCILRDQDPKPQWEALMFRDTTEYANSSLSEIGNFSSAIIAHYHLVGLHGIHFVLSEEIRHFTDRPKADFLESSFVAESDKRETKEYMLYILIAKPDINSELPFEHKIGHLYWSVENDIAELESACVNPSYLWVIVLKEQARTAYVLDVIGRLGQLTVT